MKIQRILYNECKDLLLPFFPFEIKDFLKIQHDTDTNYLQKQNSGNISKNAISNRELQLILWLALILLLRLNQHIPHLSIQPTEKEVIRHEINKMCFLTLIKVTKKLA